MQTFKSRLLTLLSVYQEGLQDEAVNSADVFLLFCYHSIDPCAPTLETGILNLI